MLVENEAIFLAALNEDLNKPELEAAIMETEFLKNEIISIHRNIRDGTTDKWKLWIVQIVITGVHL